MNETEEKQGQKRTRDPDLERRAWYYLKSGKARDKVGQERLIRMAR